MKKVCLILAGMMMLSGCSANLQANVLFDELWEEMGQSWAWRRQDVMDKEDMNKIFLEWFDVYEKKRATFVRYDEADGLQGMTVFLGKNIERNIIEMEIALGKLKDVEALQDENKKLLRPVCAAQKTRVSCGL